MDPGDAKNQRKQLGLSQVRLAAMARVSRFRYTLWELGDGSLTTEELQRIRQVLERSTKARIERLSSF